MDTERSMEAEEGNYEAAPLRTDVKGGKKIESDITMHSRPVRIFLSILQWTQLFLCSGFGAYALIYVVGMGRFRVIYPDDLTAQISIIIHIVPSALWFFLTPFQFLNPFRQRFPKAHRWIGRASVLLTFIGTIAAFVVAFTPNPEGRTATPIMMVIFGPMYLFFLLNGLRHIKNGDVRLHALYMSRAQVTSVAIIFMRPVAAVISVLNQWDPTTNPDSFGIALGIAFFFCFSLSLLVFEMIYASLHMLKVPAVVRSCTVDQSTPLVDYQGIGYVDCHLKERIPLTSSATIIRLELPDEGCKLYLRPGEHCQLRVVPEDGKCGLNEITRPYSPVDLPDTPAGCVDFIIRRVHNGQMSGFLHDCELGQLVQLSVPTSTIFKLPRYSFSKIVMIGGGTGVSPLYSISRALVQDREDWTSLSVITLNRTEDDVLLKDVFEDLSNEKAESTMPMNLSFLSDDAKAGWPEHVPSSGDEPNVLFLVCGPPGMMYSVMKTLRKEKGYGRSNIFALGIDDR